MSFTVVTDTSGNLLNEHVKAYDLKVIPFSYFVNGEEHTCLDTDQFDGNRFYDLLDRGMKVMTSQITPQKYADFFIPILAEGKDVLYVSMSSGISGSCESSMIGAQIALEAFPDRKIEVIDTRGASLGEGLIALEAAKLRDAGMELQPAAEKLREMAERMFNVFTVNDLMFLRSSFSLTWLLASH